MIKEFNTYEEKDILPVLTECFAIDKELLDKYHIEAPADLNTCVSRTYMDLQKAPSLKFFVIKCYTEDTDEIAGFFGTEKVDGLNFLTSFFIKPKYRNRDTMDYFWAAVERETGKDLFTALYARNERAKKFIEKKGLKLIKTMNIGEKSDALIYSKN